MHYKLNLIPLTPIHIGTGESIEPFEYVITDNLYKFQPEKFVSSLAGDEQKRFMDTIEKGMFGVRQFVKDRIKQIYDIKEYSTRVSPEALRLYEQRLSNPKSDLSIFPFIKTSGAPFIPGSSLKGAIRTAILYEKVKKPVSEINARKLEAETFGYARYREGIYQGIDITNDVFKTLKISDSQKVDISTILRSVTVHTKKGNDWREDIPLLREVCLSKLFDNADLTFLHTLQLAELDKPSGSGRVDLKEIIRSCRNFYLLHLKEEKEYLASFPKAAKWYKILEECLNALPENAFLVRFGWGSGFDGVTINYARKNREIKRSRRLAEGEVPLGWAEIRIDAQSGFKV